MLIISEANLHKYVGCFNKKYFKELKPIEDFRDCELTCRDTPFYGFNSVNKMIFHMRESIIKLTN